MQINDKKIQLKGFSCYRIFKVNVVEYVFLSIFIESFS